jgi:putative component of toxin-antitoxin plasmid stabilization module
MKAILELRFNPGEGIAYVQSAAKGLSLLCCRSRANNETKEIKERELALNAME